ncbi:hypothetical protein FN846DRAFT_999544 [Sphaerosporella brunnea]|uniref:Uncharacterized protein n=1 Tax=Sphaerosporella brunnea TaxID=1250544 RepID=A0A5J5EGX6_9PEZI|nr:hypothetical protein FN846DRAFT_999544 [Sphaerosporella brunnea]
MSPKVTLKRIFDDANLVNRTDVILYQDIMRVCRRNGWDEKTGVYQVQMHEHTEWPAFLRTIANGVRLYEIYPELYVQPIDKCRVYTLLDGLFRYAQQNRGASWFCKLTPPPAVQTVIHLTVGWDLSYPAAAPPPPLPHQPVLPASTMEADLELAIHNIQTCVDGLPKVITDIVEAKLDEIFGKRKLQCDSDGGCDDEAEGSAKRTRV